MVILSKSIVYGGGVVLAAQLGRVAANSFSFYLGKCVYPMSIYDSDTSYDDVFIEQKEEYYEPNMGLLINKKRYEQMLSVQKIGAAIVPVFGGALVAGLVGGAIMGVVTKALNLESLSGFDLNKSTIAFSLIGAVEGSLHDPVIGLPGIVYWIGRYC